MQQNIRVRNAQVQRPAFAKSSGFTQENAWHQLGSKLIPYSARRFWSRMPPLSSSSQLRHTARVSTCGCSVWALLQLFQSTVSSQSTRSHVCLGRTAMSGKWRPVLESVDSLLAHHQNLLAYWYHFPTVHQPSITFSC